ncbi:MAG TPA: rhomboid family intramembrane serine protease [Candidatus Angelobacter sp.]|nr:rhomboid family intramembrane serine protease [Candidatus Angelobacter sp.]
MIPLRDDAPRSTTPFVNYFLIAFNLLVFLFQATLSPPAEANFVASFGFVPDRVDQWVSGQAPASVAIVPLFTSMFLHGSWGHVLANMWFLFIFGDNVEDRLGHFRYLISYVLSGLGGALTHLLFNLHSQVPTVGASGAIAGILGAYFLLFPAARVLTWFGFFVLWLPAWLVLGYWFVLQFLSGAAGQIYYPRAGGGIAFWAHVGGFLTGMLLVKILPVRRAAYSFED